MIHIFITFSILRPNIPGWYQYVAKYGISLMILLLAPLKSEITDHDHIERIS